MKYNKNDDYRDKEKKVIDFCKKHAVIIITIGTLGHLILFVLSLIFNMRGVAGMIGFIYLECLILFLCDINEKIFSSQRFLSPLIIWLLAFVLFIGGLFTK